MAQTGSFLPGENSTFMICNQIMTHFQHDDLIGEDSSTFTTEMENISFIMKKAISGFNLILIDELGKSTTISDGASIGYSVLSYLAKLPRKNFIIVTSHFNQLGCIEDFFTNVQNMYLEVKELNVNNNTQLEYTYKIKNGVNNAENYGIKLTNSFKMLSQHVTPKAISILKVLNDNLSFISSEGLIKFSPQQRTEKFLKKVASSLQTQHTIDCNSNDNLRDYIKSIKKFILKGYSLPQ